MVIWRAFIPEMLYPNVAELRDNYLEITRRADFKKSLKLFKDYVGDQHRYFMLSVIR